MVVLVSLTVGGVFALATRSSGSATVAQAGDRSADSSVQTAAVSVDPGKAADAGTSDPQALLADAEPVVADVAGVEPTGTTACVVEASKLGFGDAGPDVSCLQGALVDAGLLASVSGDFDAATADAVRSVQTQRSMFVDGVVGRETALSLGIWPDEAAQVVRTPVPAKDAVDLMGYRLSSVASAGDDAPPLPPDSGSGRRLVYDRAGQRIWAVDEKGRIVRSWLVSGSKYGNETPGVHEVYSRSEMSTAWNGKAFLPKMVRWLKTDIGAIGVSWPASSCRGQLAVSDRGRARYEAVGGLSTSSRPRCGVQLGLRPDRHESGGRVRQSQRRGLLAVVVGVALVASACSNVSALPNAKAPDTVQLPPMTSDSTPTSLTVDSEPGPESTSTIAVPAPTGAATTTSSATVVLPAVEPTSTSGVDVATVAAVTETSLAAIVPDIEVIGPLDPPAEAVGHADGPATKVVQARLLQLGFWNSGVDGDFGLTTRQAVMAFQKYAGVGATGEVDETTAATLSSTVQRVRGPADTGNLIEIDKQRQLLFIVRDGKTLWALNTSTGNGLPYEQEDVNTPGSIVRGVALTPDGLWKVDRERPEGWWEGDLGQIYRPKYFRGGIAVHGSNAIPNYPASHGCVRVSVPAMDFIWAQDLMPMGAPVWVHTG